MPEHNTLTGTAVHEEKLISTSGTSDAGKVVTPSSSTAGTGELRNLVETEINSRKVYLIEELDDLSTSSSTYIAVPIAGTVTNVWTVLHNAITSADATITVKPNGSAATNGTITVTQSGSAAGDVDTCAPTASHTVAVGDYIEIATDGASSTAARVTITTEITAS